MISEKKGFLVLGILFISLFYPALVLGQGDGDNEGTSTGFVEPESIGMWVNCDSESECKGKEETISYYCPPDGDCTGDCDSQGLPTDPGCRFYLTEVDDWDFDDACISPALPPGYNVNDKYENTDTRLGELRFDLGLALGLIAYGLLGGALFEIAGIGFADGLIDSNADAATAAKYVPFKFKKPNGVLCGNENKWLQCDENHVGAQYWVSYPVEVETSAGEKVTITAPLLLHECTEKEDDSGATVYVWVQQATDIDHDGYRTDQNDCFDSPYSDPLPDCPKLKQSEYQGLTQQQIRQQVKELCEENPKYGQCAICINPGAREVCGDGINNDCGGPQAPQPGYKDPTAIQLGPTPDNCHTFREGCEQKTFTETGHPGGVANTSGDEDTPDFANIYHTNIYGQPFSWIDLKDGTGYCCGMGENGDGLKAIGDLGKVGEAVDGDYLCLNKNFVGSAPERIDEIYWGPKQSTDDPEPSTETGCKGEWCWIPAAGEPAFHVLTVKPPGQQPYDVVSNSEEWFPCAADAPPTLELPLYEGSDGTSFLEVANRFHCYQEGEHWSWAECHGTHDLAKNANTIKGRLEGEGLYSLYLTDRETNPNGELYGDRIEINIINKGQYQEFYDEALDFAYYDHLEFMLRFAAGEAGEEITAANKNQVFHLPAQVLVEIHGPEQQDEQGQEEVVTYLKRPVLGDLVNNPVWEGKQWMQVKIPLPTATAENGEEAPLKGIEQIVITSNLSTNIIGVKNVRLSKEGEETKLCSGEDDFTTSSWLTDLDAGNRAQTKVTAEKLCTALYGDKAWLGNDDEVEADNANCCGNDPQREYYAGKSRLQEDGKFYGCWNSQPIADKETTMNVEYSVTYQDRNKEVKYQDVRLDEATLDYVQSKVRFVTFYGTNSEYDNNWCTTLLQEPEQCSPNSICYNPIYPGDSGTCPYAVEIPQQNYKLLSEVPLDFSNFYKVEELPSPSGGPGLLPVTALYIEEKITSYPIDNLNLNFLTPFIIVDDTLTLRQSDLQWNGEDYPGEFTPKLVLTDAPAGVEALFLNPVTKLEIVSPATITASKLTIGPTPFYIIVRSNNLQLEATDVETTQTKPFTYICSNPKGECLYPLPGEPGASGYTITNPHPDLYELSFVYGSNQGEEIPVGSQLITPANTPGMLKARKVAQQIVFVNTGEEVEQPEMGFYGCAAPASLQQNLPSEFTAYTNEGYCASRGERFCSPSYPVEKVPGDLKEKYTLINTWSDLPVEQVGYLAPQLEELPANITVLQQNQLPSLRSSGADATGKSPPFLAKERTQLTSVLPARNFISNAELLTISNELPHWELFDGQGQKIDNERGPANSPRIHDGQADLAAGEVLRSERLAVPQQALLQFSSSSSCEPTIMMIDQEGNPAGNAENLAQMETSTASYLTLAFTGSCTVKEPLLQLLDDLGSATYAQAQRPVLTSELTDNTARSGLACCPQNYCWNGYACVEPMGSYTYLAEHISEGRDYRCLNGEWSYMPVRKDWNNKQWGFCEHNEQCFVQSSSTGASKEFTAAQFYENKVPTCINDTEFIFDHYCQQGAWSSRTKFIASKLLEVAGEKYTLYCTNYQDALVNKNNFGDKELWLGGSPAGESSSPAGLGEAIAGAEPEQRRACFPNLQAAGLVQPEENSCINNVCVLKASDGAVSLATSLNWPLADQSNSFLFALNIPPEKLDTVCAGSGEVIECDLAGLELEGDLWYSPELQALFYGREGLTLTPTTMDKILDWFKDLFGLSSALSDEKRFVQQAQNFRELYLLAGENKKVRAVQEIFPEKKTLVAEYENFKTPVCDYVKHLQTSATVSPIEAAAQQEKLSCTVQDNLQRVEAVEALDVFWPQLSGMLRVG